MSDERRDREAEQLPLRHEPSGAAQRPYQSPRIVKKRAVSRATLFSGGGPDSGGVVSAGG
jgi:hypothetical protein